jgi:hypothetical protein
MRLEDLHPTHESFMYLERHLNDGSPSGFSFLYTPTTGFCAKDNTYCFDLPVFDCSSLGPLDVGGACSLPDRFLPVHPDMESNFTELTGLTPSCFITSSPTSSGRTLLVTDTATPFYVKVAYQGLLGRVTRNMTNAHVLSAVEVSSVYESAIKSNELPSTIHIYREHYGMHFDKSSMLSDWGYVERDVHTFPKSGYIEIPGFSLTASNKIESGTLFKILLNEVPELRTQDGFFSYFARPLLDLYFSSIIKIGLQPECHSQNVVFLLNNEYLPVGVALRDMESVDKDLPLIKERNLDDHFTATNYKFLLEGTYNYQIMHSFMYDFKLGEYLLGPLVDGWVEYDGNCRKKNIENQIKAYAREYIRSLPCDFFPENCWYDYEAVVHEGSSKRQYRINPCPRFR